MWFPAVFWMILWQLCTYCCLCLLLIFIWHISYFQNVIKSVKVWITSCNIKTFFFFFYQVEFHNPPSHLNSHLSDVAWRALCTCASQMTTTISGLSPFLRAVPQLSHSSCSQGIAHSLLFASDQVWRNHSHLIQSHLHHISSWQRGTPAPVQCPKTICCSLHSASFPFTPFLNSSAKIHCRNSVFQEMWFYSDRNKILNRIRYLVKSCWVKD